jgi:hypothetical protein
MIHDRFDIERWKKLFPLSKLRAEARAFVEKRHAESPGDFDSSVEEHTKLMGPSGEIVTSPCHMAVVEQLRLETLSGRCLPKYPTDVFVFGNGEPNNPCCTKIGGVPFWPTGKKWPINAVGTPMGFIAQFCFSDSKDLFPEMPGDLLLVFANGSYKKRWMPDEQSDLHFEWVKIPQTTPIMASDVPDTSWKLLPFYGEIHRTADFLTGGFAEPKWWSVLMKHSKSIGEFWSGLTARRVLEKRYHQSWSIPVIEGTKIGGIPRWIQNADKMPGRFLCALSSVHPTYQTGVDDSIHRPHPFTNVAAPLVRKRGAIATIDGSMELPTDGLLKWGDVGSLFLFLGDGGEIHWTCQSY